MKKRLEQFIKILIFCTFFVPLVVVPSSFIFPFIVPKILLFRSLVLIMLGGYIVLLMINFKEYRPKLTPLNILVILFLISFTISSFVGVDPYHSFWDNHERMLGLFTIIHYVLYYFICSAVFKSWTDWRMALRIFLIAGSLVIFVGFLQKINPFLLLNQGNPQIASTLGNSIYVGGYGLFLAFVAGLLIVKEKEAAWRYTEIVLGILALLGIIWSGTRGAALGFMVGAFVTMLGYVVVLKDQPKVRKLLGALMVGAIVVLGIFYLERQTTFVKSVPVLGKLVNSSFESGTGSTRLIAWKVAIESWKEKPIFGWGPNNFFYAFNKHYNPISLNFGYGETWFDNAHNIILNTLAVQGLFGVIVYLAIFGGAIFYLWRYFYKNKGSIDQHILVIFSGFLIGHLVQNITVFENPTSYLYFIFSLAFINQVIVRSQSSVLKQSITLSPDHKIGVGLFGVIAVMVIVLMIIFNLQPARANQNTFVALSQMNPDLMDSALIKMKVALNFDSPHIDDIRGDIARSVVPILNTNYQKLGIEKTNQILEVVIPALQENIALHPLDIRNHIILSELLQIKAVANNDIKSLAEAEHYLKQALQYSPHRQQVIYALVALQPQLNKALEAVALLNQTIQDNPKITEGYWRAAYIYKFVLDQPKKAEEIINLAKKNGVVFTDQEQKMVNNILSTPLASSSLQ